MVASLEQAKCVKDYEDDDHHDDHDQYDEKRKELLFVAMSCNVIASPSSSESRNKDSPLQVQCSRSILATTQVAIQ